MKEFFIISILESVIFVVLAGLWFSGTGYEEQINEIFFYFFGGMSGILLSNTMKLLSNV